MIALPHNVDDNDYADKALLADDGHDDVSPPPYQSKRWSAISIFGFGIFSTVSVGLIILCFVWHIAGHKAGQSTRLSSIHTSHSMHPSKLIPADILDNLAHAEELGSEFDENTFAGWKDCGSSVEEARAKGCFFDVMLHSWVSAECADKELMDEYLAKVPYKWYRDWKTKDEITVEEMRRGEHGMAAVKLEEHGTHCAYVLEKNMRALMSGKPLARSIYSIKHAVHCLGLLVDPATIPGDFTTVVVEYDQCGIPHFD